MISSPAARRLALTAVKDRQVRMDRHGVRDHPGTVAARTLDELYLEQMWRWPRFPPQPEDAAELTGAGYEALR